MKYGLIGKSLPYSYSKTIHNLFGLDNYLIQEINPDSLKNYILKKDYSFINITIPYKEEVIKYLDNLDESVILTNSCNLIINKDNKLIGYNTDYLAFIDIFNSLSLSNKKVLILGTGATSRSLSCALKYLGLKDIYFASTSKCDKKTVFNYDNLSSIYNDIDYIFNTTPLSTYPNELKSLIDNNKFNKLSYVYDCVYNPLFSKLLIDASYSKIKCDNGLKLLTVQAYKTLQLANIKINNNISNVYNKIRKDILNIVFIGMPSCGKTKIGTLISFEYNYNFVDLDDLYTRVYHISPKDEISINKETIFREKEAHLVKEISNSIHTVISTGGGVILNKDNMINLKKNSLIFFIDRPLEDLESRQSNPLTSNYDLLKKTYIERIDLYKKYADYIIDGKTLDSALDSIKEKINEYFNS